jgi:hypothetical protein
MVGGIGLKTKENSLEPHFWVLFFISVITLILFVSCFFKKSTTQLKQ